jgi:predicted transposase YbfD/YdcC
MAVPLLDPLDIEGKDVTADALLTQRKFAEYLGLIHK